MGVEVPQDRRSQIPQSVNSGVRRLVFQQRRKRHKKSSSVQQRFERRDFVGAGLLGHACVRSEHGLTRSSRRSGGLAERGVDCRKFSCLVGSPGVHSRLVFALLRGRCGALSAGFGVAPPHLATRGSTSPAAARSRPFFRRGPYPNAAATSFRSCETIFSSLICLTMPLPS